MAATDRESAYRAQAHAVDTDTSKSLAATTAATADGATPTAVTTTMSSTATLLAGAAATAGVYYVDSRIGNDALDGAAATATGTVTGPWRTLAKLAAAPLKPGDVVRLVCGSTWSETLRVGASGTSAAAISLAAYPSGCSNPPVIDGAVTLPNTAWALHKGNIYKTTLSATPLQLNATTGFMTMAHHPNRGFNPTKPTSLYLAAAADGNKTTVNGKAVSTALPVGTDLVFPTGASLQTGAVARIRINAWSFDELPISSLSAGKLNLATPTSYPIAAGWGYYLIGNLWMLDSAGEWHYDSATKTLYTWMADSRVPDSSLAVTTLPTGIDLQSRQYVSIDGVTIRRVGTAIDARQSVGVSVRGSRIESAAQRGVNGAGSTSLQIASTTFTRTGQEAILGVDSLVGLSTGMRVTGNVISQSALALESGKLVSLPIGSVAAITAGNRATVTGNQVSDTAYHGIRTVGSSTVSANQVTNPCVVLDDCGGIYVYGAASGTTIQGNTVRDVLGGLEGKPPGSTSQAQGIFLDDHASGVTVSGNTVTNAEVGVFIHNSNTNTVKANVLYGNRKHQIWLMEESRQLNPAGDIYGNVITDNQLFSTAPNAALGQQSVIGDTTRFASYDRNRYSALISSRVVTEFWPTGSSAYQFPQWQAATTATGTARLPDAAGSVVNAVGFASFRTLGSNIVPNGAITAGNTGWTPWNDTAPLATALARVCDGKPCLEVTAGATSSLVATPPFAVTAGNWYRVSFDVRSTVVGQPISVLVRRGGGGTNGFESLMGSPEMVNGPAAFQRFSFAFKSAKTINVNDPVTRDYGARLYFDRIQPGNKITLMNVEIVPVTAADATVKTYLLANPTAAAVQTACPDQATSPARCSQYFEFANGRAVTWPLTIGANGSTVVYSRDTSLVDTDGDGISDSQDQCPATPAGRVTNAVGCSL